MTGEPTTREGGYDSWRCLERACSTGGRWQVAPFPKTAEDAWTEHWRTEHAAVEVTP